MGIHICVYDKNFKEASYETWDFLRHGCDKDFINLIDETINHKDENDDEIFYFRPKNINEIKEKIKTLDCPNPERYYKLLELCESGFWIYLSV